MARNLSPMRPDSWIVARCLFSQPLLTRGLGSFVLALRPLE
jgi:hypothetical protein